MLAPLTHCQTGAPSVNLDATEYLHLALHAVQKGDHHAALLYLKNVLELQPDNSAAHYLMAAEHAELGLLERAAEGMAESLLLDPGLDIARFQLGLLKLQLDRIPEAAEAFGTLVQVSTDTSLREFASGYMALIAEDKALAIPHFAAGLELCDNNLALKQDMTRVLDSLQPASTIDEASASAPSVSLEKPSDTASLLFLGAYRDSLDSGHEPD